MTNRDFIGVPIGRFTCSNLAPVDLYLKLAEANYIKVVRAGDPFERYRLRSSSDPAVKDVYFRKVDFSTYLTYCVALVKRLTVATNQTGEKDFELTARIADLTFLSLRSAGVTTGLATHLEEMCAVIVEQTKDTRSFQLFMNDMLNMNDGLARHSLATTLISLVITHGLKWKSDKNIETVAIGALLHDLGLLNYPEVYEKPKSAWSEATKAAYLGHPQSGASLVLAKKLATDNRVVRIIADHEELPDGSGFPNNLVLSRIYPMALPVIMADRLVDLLLSPDSPLPEPAFAAAVRYMQNREAKFYPAEYWHVLEKATAWML